MVENESYDYKEELNDDFQSPCSSIQWTCMVLHTSLAKKSSSHHSSLDQGVGIISRTSLSRLLGRWCLPRNTSWTTPNNKQTYHTDKDFEEPPGKIKKMVFLVRGCPRCMSRQTPPTW